MKVSESNLGYIPSYPCSSLSVQSSFSLQIGEFRATLTNPLCSCPVPDEMFEGWRKVIGPLKSSKMLIPSNLLPQLHWGPQAQHYWLKFDQQGPCVGLEDQAEQQCLVTWQGKPMRASRISSGVKYPDFCFSKPRLLIKSVARIDTGEQKLSSNTDWDLMCLQRKLNIKSQFLIRFRTCSNW